MRVALQIEEWIYRLLHTLITTEVSSLKESLPPVYILYSRPFPQYKLICFGCRRLKGEKLSPHLLGETKNKGIKNDITGLASELVWLVVVLLLKHLLHMTWS